MDSPFDPGTQGNQDLPVWTRREGISGLKPHCVPAPGPGSSLVSAFDLNKDGWIRWQDPSLSGHDQGRGWSHTHTRPITDRADVCMSESI